MTFVHPTARADVFVVLVSVGMLPVPTSEVPEERTSIIVDPDMSDAMVKPVIVQLNGTVNKQCCPPGVGTAMVDPVRMPSRYKSKYVSRFAEYPDIVDTAIL
ncbi:MAG: hypothetical protein NTV01_00415 [Bacteroidia bacterium]|nr:hypothetical protein [Bacteroidia bacterium]